MSGFQDILNKFQEASDAVEKFLVENIQLGFENKNNQQIIQKYSEQRQFENVMENEENQLIDNRLEELDFVDQIQDQDLNCQIFEDVFKVPDERKRRLYQKYMNQQDSLKKELENKYKQKYYQYDNNSTLKRSGKIRLLLQPKQQILTFQETDFDKLCNQTFLNDTIIDNYLQIIQHKLIPKQTAKKTHIFSSFLMYKLIIDIFSTSQSVKIDNKKQMEVSRLFIRQKIKNIFINVKKWYKNVDILSKKYLVFPINYDGHWSCHIVLIFHQQEKDLKILDFKLLWLDPAFSEQMPLCFIIQFYLEQLIRNRNTNQKVIKMKSFTIQTIITPKQIKLHDCGLNSLCNVEYLLKNPEKLQKINNIDLFPNSLIFCFRHLLRQLFYSLLNLKQNDNYQKSVDFIIRKFENQKKMIIEQSQPEDYQQISQHQVQKYQKLYFENQFELIKLSLGEKQQESQEQYYQLKQKDQQTKKKALVKFHYDPMFAHFQKVNNHD